MLAEISIHPQVGRDIRPEVTRTLEEIEHAGMRYEVEPFSTVTWKLRPWWSLPAASR